MNRTTIRRRTRQARYHGAALTVIAVFYLPPAVYAITAIVRVTQP